MEFDPILGFDESDKEFEHNFNIVQSNVMDSLNWYRSFVAKKLPMWLFRLSGSLVIINSVAIPAVASSELPWRENAVVFMALSIAIFSGLNTFFKWGEKWQSSIVSELAIKHLIGLWKIDIHRAKSAETISERLELANNSTEELLEKVGVIVAQETEEYFSKVKWPKKQN